MYCHNSIAIIGDGVGALICYALLRHTGIPAAAITIYGDQPHPLTALANAAQAIRQSTMRSEGNGHLAPYEFPGLALRDAWYQRSLWPLVQSLFDIYNPSLNLLLTQGSMLVERTGFLQRKVCTRIEHIQRIPSAQTCFTLINSNGQALDHARHVILALGPAGLAWPDPVRPWLVHPCVVHAYTPHTVESGEHVVVLGSGMAAAHSWINALEAGAHVTAVHRHPLRRQRLNSSRCDFSTVGIEAYQRLHPEQRMAYLQTVGQGSFPRRWQWEWTWWHARRSGRLTTCRAELLEMQAHTDPNSEQLPLILHLNNQSILPAARLICATGFNLHALAYPLIRRLMATGGVSIKNGLLLVEDDFTLAPISHSESKCFVVGSLARWALPVANTFVGLKYAARRIAGQLRAYRDQVS